MKSRSIRLLAVVTLLAAGSTVHAQVKSYSSLYSFPGTPEGSNPLAALTIGNYVLYGTTVVGGSFGNGTVFMLTPPASSGAGWNSTVLHNFAGPPNDGYSPYNAGITIGRGGVLYGTTSAGGSANFGTVFAVIPPSSSGGEWTETVLYNFTGGDDGGTPESNVVIGRGGVLYGTTNVGGTGPCSGGCGTVFALTPPASPGGTWTETVLHSFTGTPGDGASPLTGVRIGTGGVLYGTTVVGGTTGNGTVYALTPPASLGDAWTESVLYSFAGGTDGSEPAAGVVIWEGGVLYGTTYGGGTGRCTNGCGTVFSLTPPASAGGAWTEAIVHNFRGGARDGAYPSAGVVLGAGGVLYGTTYAGGTAGYGTVFKLAPPSTSGYPWVESVLHDFAGQNDGAYPFAGVVLGPNGLLYGTAENGGNSNCSLGCGTMFRLKP